MSNLVTSNELPLAAQISPQSCAASASKTSGWVDAGKCSNVLTIVTLGALGGGSVALTHEQARDDQGDGAKPVTAWSGGTSTADNSSVVVNNDPAKLDMAGGFRFVRAKLANTGGTGALLAASVHLASPRHAS